MSNDIDWSQPVEYNDLDLQRSLRGDDSWLPVVFSVENRDGSRLCVILDPCGDYDAVHFDRATRNRFRNVRRKVKHERWLAFKSNGGVNVYEFDPRESKDKIFMADVVDVRWLEWEADADE